MSSRHNCRGNDLNTSTYSLSQQLHIRPIYEYVRSVATVTYTTNIRVCTVCRNSNIYDLFTRTYNLSQQLHIRPIYEYVRFVATVTYTTYIRVHTVGRHSRPIYEGVHLSRRIYNKCTSTY